MNPGIIINRLAVGALSANCYIVHGDKSPETVVIDPGGDPDEILEKISGAGLTVRHIVNTHGHVDHTAACSCLREALKPGPAVCIHAEDAPMLRDPHLNLSSLMESEFRPLEPDVLLHDDDTIKAGGIELRVLHTPGHTPGGICLAGEGFVFTGDTLFASGIGRTDFAGGDHCLLMRSIKEKLLRLGEETVIYPGHGPESTIGRERSLLTEWE